MNDLNVVNTLPNTLITNHLIPKFYENYENSQKKSAIINIGSAMPKYFNYPLQTDYVATKQYINHLTRCLQKEVDFITNYLSDILYNAFKVDDQKIDILLVTPTNVNSLVG